jgi:hypothetical protein
MSRRKVARPKRVAVECRGGPYGGRRLRLDVQGGLCTLPFRVGPWAGCYRPSDSAGVVYWVPA